MDQDAMIVEKDEETVKAISPVSRPLAIERIAADRVSAPEHFSDA